jgi:hypothetical protein
LPPLPNNQQPTTKTSRRRLTNKSHNKTLPPPCSDTVTAAAYNKTLPPPCFDTTVATAKNPDTTIFKISAAAVLSLLWHKTSPKLCRVSAVAQKFVKMLPCVHCSCRRLHKP